jgi:hypothetical protein
VKQSTSKAHLGRRIILSTLILLAALLLFIRLCYPGRPQTRLPAGNCNAGLWKHVYEPERLEVIEACSAVDGRVVSVHRAVDGDLHIGLEPDRKSVLNLINVMHAERRLVVEIVCDYYPPDHGAVPFCAGFTSQVTAPKVGDRVRVIGAYVTDRDNGWREIHPVTSIETLP